MPHPFVPTDRRGLVIGLLLCAWATAQPAEPIAKSGSEPTKAFFSQHCQACHTGNKPKGNFRLESLSTDFGDRANREKWLTVLDQLKSGTMPPKDKPRPSTEDVKTVTAWISGKVGKIGASQGR